ncbi:MAG: chorismate synthase [Clostridia bacterium]|nr:chorismate synthase [Clostridia bacterium]
MAKNTFGNALKITIFGESHGAGVGVVIDGMTPGIDVDAEFINHQLELRRPSGRISTTRRESDPWQAVSGVFEGKTTGTSICLLIPNGDTRSRDYTPSVARPGHADFSAQCKYHGAQDYRGGGHFSGRITAGLVAAGGILIPALRKKGIEIGTHLARCAGVSDLPLDGAAMGDDHALREQLRLLGERAFPTLDSGAGERMVAAIEQAKMDADSVGGVLETAIVGLPAGLGEPWFDSLEGQLAHALFSIPGIKGVEFGAGFAMSEMRGSEANDPFRVIEDRIVTATNRNGGINGGITNGMPVTFRCAVKPTPSIAKEQQTVDFYKCEEQDFVIHGRHDPCIAHRARIVVDSVAAMVVADALLQRYGNDALA